MKARAYTALVRPQLEYGSEAWNPHNITTVNGLEQIQKRSLVCSDYRNSTSSSSLVSSLKWDCLHTRRILTQCTLFYKIQNQLVATPFPPIILPATYYVHYDHNPKYAVLQQPLMSINFHSSRDSSCRIWNHLPAQAVNTKGTDNFKEAALPVLRLMQPPVFQHTIDIRKQFLLTPIT